MASRDQAPPGWAAYDPVDAGFLDARGKLLEVAAFLDRAQRAGRAGDYRVRALLAALPLVRGTRPAAQRAAALLRALSDPTAPPARTAGPPAAGAWDKGGKQSNRRKPR